MNFSLKNKKLIVTGATSGIGQAIAIAAAQAGADIAFCGHTDVGADETMAAIEKAGQRHFFKVVQLADLDATRAFGEEAIDFLGGLDGLVNNAGANLWHGVTDSTYEQLDLCFRVNFYHAWALSQVAYPVFRAAGGGKIVNMSSINAERTLPGVFPYNVAKAMLVALTKSQAIEWGRDNIQTVAIEPGLVMTALGDDYFNRFPDPVAEKARMLSHYPLYRGGRPDDIASFVVYFLSSEQQFMSGNAVLIDGGISALVEVPNGW